MCTQVIIPRSAEQILILYTLMGAGSLIYKLTAEKIPHLKALAEPVCYCGGS